MPTSRLGLAGIGACILGLVMTVGAAGIYPRPTGSNINFDANILFAVVFFAGEFIGLLGLGASDHPRDLPAAEGKKRK